MTAVVMDGTALSKERRAALADELRALGSPAVCLATVLVGDDGPSRRYVASKQKLAAEIGMQSRHVGLPADASQGHVDDTVAALAADASVHAILVQMPLPDGLDTEHVLSLIPATKDVDGLTPASLGLLVRGQPGLVPCTPLGVMRLLEKYGVATKGKRAAVLGRSMLVGMPVALLLAAKGVDATVTIGHSRTPDLRDICVDADIIVSAVGVGGLVKADWVKPGAAVIDVGISRTEAGIVGDIAYDEVAPRAGWITPMPGGTGPMTVACLLENTLSAARLQGAV